MTSIDTALRRSFEAEIATDAVLDEPSIDANKHASELHREAAEWHAKAGNSRRALMHHLQSKVHAHVAVQLTDQHRAEGRPQ